MSGKKSYNVRISNILIALALTLMVNLSFLISGGETRGRNPSFTPSLSTVYLLFQMAYFMVLAWCLVSINTLKRWSIGRKTVISLGIVLFFYLILPTLHRNGHWIVPLSMPRRLYNPMSIMKFSFVLIVSVLYGKILDLIFQKQNIILENERLKNENLQTRYNMLANQISPHFLFNSLNSLSMLVREQSNDKALLYINQLADTFRYMLQSGQEELTSLDEEVKFTEAYLYLLLIRYENKLFCDIRIDEPYRRRMLPVLSLQPLIENAVKHNTLSRANPLRISMYTENDKVIVSNPIIPKIDPPDRTGIGLKNLASRYLLITGKEIRVSNDGYVFKVTLPLMRCEEK